MRSLLPATTATVVLLLLSALSPAIAAGPRVRVPHARPPVRLVSGPKVVHPKVVQPKVVRPHTMAGPKISAHPFVMLQPINAYHRAYLPYGYHHSRSYHRRYGTHHHAYRPYGRYGRNNRAFQQSQAELRRLQAVAVILNAVPRGAAANPATVSSLQHALSSLVVKGPKPPTNSVHSLAIDLVSTLQARTRPLIDPMQLAYDLEAVLNGHVITPVEVNMAMSSANAVLRGSGIPTGRLQALDMDMRQVGLANLAQARH
jgi:hypothetical protein